MPQRVEVVLSDEEREVLERWARRPKSSQALALRCRIVLAAAEGEPSRTLRLRWGAAPRRSVSGGDGSRASGLDGLHDEPRPGKPRSIGDEDLERVIVKTLEEQPRERDALVDALDGPATGMSQTAVSRIWRAFGLKPHQTETLQALARPAVHRQGPRHRRALSQPARCRRRAVRR